MSILSQTSANNLWVHDHRESIHSLFCNVVYDDFHHMSPQLATQFCIRRTDWDTFQINPWVITKRQGAGTVLSCTTIPSLWIVESDKNNTGRLSISHCIHLLRQCLTADTYITWNKEKKDKTKIVEI